MKVTVTHPALVLVLVASLQNLPLQAVNPGFRAILTTKGLNYAHNVGLCVFKEWLSNYTIPTINITSQVGLANVEYNFSNIEIPSLDLGETLLTSDTRGVVLAIKDASFSFSSDYDITETDWPYFTDIGSGDVSVRGLSVAVSVDLLANGSDGRFALNLTSCSFSIDTVDLIFSGGASYMYNLFAPALSGYLKRELHQMACQELTNLTNNITDKYVDDLPTKIKVGDGVEIDYGLVSNANFSKKGRIVTDHRGEFLLESSPMVPPFKPHPLPDPSDNEFPESSMIHIVISTYVADTAAYAFWMAGQLAYNVTSDKLWIFKTTKAWCASTLVPQSLCDDYPHWEVMLGIAVSSRPTLNVTHGHTVLQARASVTMFVSDSSGREDTAFTLEFRAEANVVPYFEEESNRICGNVSSASVIDLNVTHSKIGYFNATKLEDVITNVLLPLGVNYINIKYTQPGFPIPVKDGVSFTNSTIKYGEGYIVVSSDISYTPTFIQANMTCLKST